MGLATQTDGVSIAIARDPALVRTARLVAAAVARRADRPDTVIEAVRLAVGEACAVMIGVDEPATPLDPAERVEVTLRSDASGFSVTVSGSIADPDPSFEGIDLDPWALLRGISDELTISSEGAVTTVRMSWPG